MKTKSKKGFSLVELLVVITIIAILSVVAYTAMGGQTVTARDSKRKQDLSTMQSALELYFIEFGIYPYDPLTSGTETGWIPKKYLSEIPKDPKGDDYAYAVSGSNTFQIAATLENEGTPKAYVVGNSDTNLITGIGGCGLVIDDEACLPYDIND